MARAAQDTALYAARNLRADIRAAEAGLHLAERELLDTVVRAPFDGYVKQRQVGPGQFVSTQTPIVTLVRINPLKLVAEFPEQMMPWVRVGQKVTVRIDAFPGAPVEGMISRISPAVNTATRAFPVEASVPNRDGRLKPGTFARAQLASDLVEPVVTIPASAIQNRYGVNRVFLIARGTLSAREVALGDRVGNRVEIESGLEPGDQVGTLGRRHARRRDGRPRRTGHERPEVDPGVTQMSLSELSVRRPVFATMLVCFVVVLGIFSFMDLGVDLFPRADPPRSASASSCLGRVPQEMTSAVVEPFEEALSGLSGVDEISARVTEGTATVTVRFVLERDINDASNDVREKVARRDASACRRRC